MNDPQQRGFSEKISTQTSPVYLPSPQTSPFPILGGHLCIISALGAGHSSPCQGNLFGRWVSPALWACFVVRQRLSINCFRLCSTMVLHVVQRNVPFFCLLILIFKTKFRLTDTNIQLLFIVGLRFNLHF